VRTALDRAAGRIQGKFDEQPLVEASIRQTIGTTYRDLGLYPDAQEQVERALELRRRVLGDRSGETLESATELGLLYRRSGKYKEAEALFASVVDTSLETRGEMHADTLSIMDTLAGLYREQGKYAQAEPLLNRVLGLKRKVHGEEHPETLTTINSLGLVYLRRKVRPGRTALHERAGDSTPCIGRRAPGNTDTGQQSGVAVFARKEVTAG
jgi:tetratricopeptide (TPR) repeat protein